MRFAPRVVPSLIVAASLLCAAPHASARMVPAPPEPADLYAQGQLQLEANDYRGAAETWDVALKETPENEANRAMRENLLINVIDARISAYRQQVNGAGESEPTQLLAAQVSLRQYYRDFRDTYGEGTAISSVVQERAGLLQQELADAEPDLGTFADPPPPPGERGEPASQPAEPRFRVDNGNGLLVAGIGVGVVGFSAALTMIPLGAALGENAEGDFIIADIRYANADTSAERTIALSDRESAERTGRTANRVAIAGAIISPILLGAAAAMIVFGLQRRRSAMDERRVHHAPTLSPSYAGWSTTVSF